MRKSDITLLLSVMKEVGQDLPGVIQEATALPHCERGCKFDSSARKKNLVLKLCKKYVEFEFLNFTRYSVCFPSVFSVARTSYCKAVSGF
jgi:endonuclease YncB( thermonuclease family)